MNLNLFPLPTSEKKVLQKRTVKGELLLAGAMETEDEAESQVAVESRSGNQGKPKARHRTPLTLLE